MVLTTVYILSQHWTDLHSFFYVLFFNYIKNIIYKMLLINNFLNSITLFLLIYQSAWKILELHF